MKVKNYFTLSPATLRKFISRIVIATKKAIKSIATRRYPLVTSKDLFGDNEQSHKFVSQDYLLMNSLTVCWPSYSLQVMKRRNFTCTLHTSTQQLELKCLRFTNSRMKVLRELSKYNFVFRLYGSPSGSFASWVVSPTHNTFLDANFLISFVLHRVISEMWKMKFSKVFVFLHLSVNNSNSLHSR